MRPPREVLLAALVIAGCGHASAPPSGPASPAPPPPLAATPTALPLHIVSGGNGFTTVTAMKNRRTIYTLRAKSFVGDTVANRTATGSGTFVEPHITFVDAHGIKTVTDAPKAVLTSADKSVLMTGGVQARSQDGNVLSCDRLRYDGTTERIHGDGNVVMQTPSGLTMKGDTIDGDVRLQFVQVRRK